MNREWDVIIVGARVAGASTAMLLARAGLRVLCLDRSRPGSDTVSTHALMRAGVLQLQRWGLREALYEAATPRVQRTIFHYAEDTIAVSIKPSHGVESLLAPRRTVLDPLLVDHATRAGATFHWGSSVIGLHRDAAGNVAGVIVKDRRRPTSWVAQAPIVIGADGRNSTVAAHVAAAPVATGRYASSFVYGYWSGLPTAGYEWVYRPRLTAGVIPTNGGLTCVFVGARPSDLDSAVRDSGSVPATFDRLAAAAGLHPRLAAATQVEPLRFVRGLPAGYLRQANGSGWALVGDAGHWLDPMSTHGMTGALRDATLLAQALIAAPLGSVEMRESLSNYQAMRDKLSMPMLQISDEIASYEWDLPRVRSLVRSLSSAMTDEVEALSWAESAAS
ncbi:FAD-dependent oxidoreductase [Jatrophihabitans sp. DSM 45814]